jgi:RimJ/RimL family protein N-acetyltransferase
MALLRGETVRLTALGEGDLEVLERWHEDDEFLRLFDSNPAVPRPKASLKKWIEEAEGASDTFLFAIRSLADDVLLGIALIEDIEWSNQQGWLSIGLGNRSTWGKGYGKDATRLLVAFAFRELNLYRLSLTVFDYNVRAISLYEGIGFRREGVFREFGNRDGKRYDLVLYGLLRTEWEGHGGEPSGR